MSLAKIQSKEATNNQTFKKWLSSKSAFGSMPANQQVTLCDYVFALNREIADLEAQLLNAKPIHFESAHAVACDAAVHAALAEAARLANMKRGLVAGEFVFHGRLPADDEVDGSYEVRMGVESGKILVERYDYPGVTKLGSIRSSQSFMPTEVQRAATFANMIKN